MERHEFDAAYARICEVCGMRYVIGDSARLVTPYRGYSWVTIIGYEGDGYCVELTSGLELVVREDELEDV